MALLPIIERELRVALRKRQPGRSRLRVAALAAAGTLLFLLLATLGGNRQAGRSLHQALCLAAGYLVLRTPQLTAGVFAEERRQQTLGLLFLSGLGATEVFASKLLNVALWWIIRYTAARSLGEARRDGAYELLLTTPLDPALIVRGQFEALRWHFRLVARAVLGIEVAMMLGGLALRSWTRSSLYDYGVIWMLLALWTLHLGRHSRANSLVLWVSLNCGRPAG